MHYHLYVKSKISYMWSSLVGHQVEYPASSPQWRGFDPWPRNFPMPQAWQKKKKKKQLKTNESIRNRNRLTDIENKLWLSRERDLGDGWNGRLGLADVNYKVLLYSTGNYIQYSVIHHNGKEYF